MKFEQIKVNEQIIIRQFTGLYQGDTTPHYVHLFFFSALSFFHPVTY